jgi:hypothetical protein
MIRALRGRPVLVLGAAAAVLGCVCCVGGLADSLSPPVAIGLLGATVVLGGTAGLIAWVRAGRRFRAVRAEVTERLDRVSALRAGVVREDGDASTVTGHRIDRVHVDWTNGDVVATVTTTLFFDDGATGRLVLYLVPEDGDRWQVVSVRGAGFRLQVGSTGGAEIDGFR